MLRSTLDRDGESPEGTAEDLVGQTTNKKNLLLLVTLRWIAICGQIATILIVDFGFHLRLPLIQMASVILVLALFNLGSLYRCSAKRPIDDFELFVQLLFDLTTLSTQLFLSGGATNPFVSLFLLQVILGAVLLPSRYTWTIVALCGSCFIWLTFDYHDIGWHASEADQGEMQFFKLHLVGMFVCFALASVLLVALVTRINRNVREKQARLSQMRQHAIEQEHIVRMGLLASGAAHELSTPLATLSVILQDWERIPRLAEDPEIGVDLDEMKGALARCKDIVSRILLTAGEIRAEGAERTTIVRFLDELTEEWKRHRTPVNFDYRSSVSVDSAIAPDVILKQALFNVLDNALEASPDWLSLEAILRSDILILTVKDKGAGFPSDVLQSFGKPYLSRKEQPGTGLGLFLAVNVVRKVGGSIEARNNGDGAIVELRLPIEALSIEKNDVLS
ncbi:ATP-binding protein [Methylosinus sp. H3A]|uniref:ATP-binding protein n=1 Tax=Methylosinus sp. H3A TaxID=2785786 RepID=UPI0028968B30|nr:ATP-binding protein [Methylosinus sp. H3A]